MIVGWIYHGKTEIYEAYLNGTLIWSASMRRLAGGHMSEELLFLVGPGLEVMSPESILMQIEGMAASIGNGEVKNPEAVLLVGWDGEAHTAGGELREPDRMLLACWDGSVNTANAVSAGISPHFIICWDAMANTANAKLTVPERLNLFMRDAGVNFTDAATQSPEDILLCVRDLAVNNAAPKPHVPEDILLYAPDLPLNFAGGKTQPPEDVLMHRQDRSVLFASGKTQEPENLFMSMLLDLAFLAAGSKTQAPEYLYQFAFERPTNNAGSKTQPVEDIILYSPEYPTNNASSKTEKPEDLILYSPEYPTNNAGSKTQPPEDLLQFMHKELAGLAASSRTQPPEDHLLFSFDYPTINGGAKVEIPEGLFQFVWDAVHGAASGKTQSPEEILQRFFEAVYSFASGRTEEPEWIRLIMGERDVDAVAGRTQTPTDLFLHTVNRGGVNSAQPRIETPADWFIHLVEIMCNIAAGDIHTPELIRMVLEGATENKAGAGMQEPEDIMLRFAKPDGIVAEPGAPRKQEPERSLLYLDGRDIAGYFDPELREPDALRLLGRNEQINHVAAKKETPTAIMLPIRDGALNCAGVICINLHDLFKYSAGCAVFIIGGSVDAEITEPIVILCSTSAEQVSFGNGSPQAPFNGASSGQSVNLSGYAGGDLLAFKRAAGIAYLSQLVGIAKFHLRDTRAGGGILHFIGVSGYASGHTAKTVEGRGQPIALEFSCRMWGNAAVGRAFTLRMHTTLGYIVGHASGHNADAVHGAGVYCEIPELGSFTKPKQDEPKAIRLNADVGNITVRGGYSGLIGSVPTSGVLYLENLRGYAGGYVKIAEVTGWADPIQTGSNLYIRSVYDSYQDRTNVSIDLGEFYAPFKDGTNLHIRSVYSSYQDQTEVCIDTDIFYKPIRTGSNLHIRSDIFGGE